MLVCRNLERASGRRRGFGKRPAHGLRGLGGLPGNDIAGGSGRRPGLYQLSRSTRCRKNAARFAGCFAVGPFSRLLGRGTIGRRLRLGVRPLGGQYRGSRILRGFHQCDARPAHISPRAVPGAIGLAGHGFCATEVELGFAGISNRPQAGQRAISWPCGPKNRLGFDLDYPPCHWRRLRLSGAC